MTTSDTMRKLLCVVVICVIPAIQAVPTPCDQVCKSTPMDISFVVDNSVTVSETGFNQALSFLNGLLDNFDVGPDKVRVSVITYGRGVYLDTAIDLGDYSSKSGLVAAINGIKYHAGDYTDTGAGIEHAISQQSSARPSARHVMVVLTDGDSQDATRTKMAADHAKKTGLHVFAIGVGPTVTMNELFVIASDESHVIPTPSYDNLQDIMSQLRLKICKEEPDPPCRHTPTELMFVIDSSVSVGAADFDLGLEFINDLIQNFEVNPSTVRVAAVMFGSQVYTEQVIEFGDHDSVKSINNAISSLVWQHGSRTETGMGIDYMVDHFLPSARPHAPKVAIVLTDGESQEGRKTAAVAQRARDLGVKMVAVGIGRVRTEHEEGSLSMEELENIAGSGSNVLLADNYADLQRIVPQLVKSTCYQVEQGRQEWMWTHILRV